MAPQFEALWCISVHVAMRGGGDGEAGLHPESLTALCICKQELGRQSMPLLLSENLPFLPGVVHDPAKGLPRHALHRQLSEEGHRHRGVRHLLQEPRLTAERHRQPVESIAAADW